MRACVRACVRACARVCVAGTARRVCGMGHGTTVLFTLLYPSAFTGGCRREMKLTISSKQECLETSHIAGGDLSCKAFGQGPCLALVCQGGDEEGVDELSFGFDGDVGLFQERCKLVAGVVCFLDSCFDFSVKPSIFCKYATEVLDLGHLLELIAVDVDVEFAGCSAHLHCLGLADADLHVVFFTDSDHAICLLLQLLSIFICKALVIGKLHFF